MPGSTYSTNLKVELMATGENSGTWGDITNTNLGTALEQAIVGYGNPDYASDANLTISITNSNAAQAARALVLNVTSSVSLTATRELVVPTIQKQYIVQNNTTGSQSITVKTSAGTGITVPNGRKAHLYVNGTDVIQMFDFVDINGGAIDGTPIGGSSAAAGAFTTLNASGATTLDGNVTLGNASGDNVTVTGTITSNLLFTDNTYDIGASGATRPRNLFLAGAATIGGNLSVGGTLTLTGGLILNGNVTVGDNSSDTLTINSTITSNLIFTDNTYDIGASGATRPRNLFLAGSGTIGGNVTTAGRVIVDDTTDSSSTTTGSIQTDGGLGVAKALFVGTTLNVAGNTTLGDAAGDTLTINGTAVSTPNNLNFDSDTLVIDATNNRVGVGTGSPLTRFDVRLPDAFSTVVSNTSLNDNTSTVARFSFLTDPGATITAGTGVAISLSSVPNRGEVFLVATNASTSKDASDFAIWTTGSAVASERFRVTNSGSLYSYPAVGAEVVFNDNGVDADFRVESDTNTHAFFLDAGNSRVGINYASPATTLVLYTLDAGTTGVGTGIQLISDGGGGDNGWVSVNKGTGNGLTFAVENRDIVFTTGATTGFNGTERFRVKPSEVVVNDPGNDVDFRVESDNNSAMLFVDAGNNKVVLGGTTPETNSTLTVYQFGTSGSPGANNAQIMIDANANSGSGQAALKLLAGSGTTNRAARIDFLNGVNSTTTPQWTFLNDYNQDGTNDFNLIRGTADRRIVLTSGGIVFNEDSADVDFRVESDTSTHMLFVDAGNNAVGINQSSPSYTLDVNGSFRSAVTGGSVYTQSAGGIPRFYLGGGSGFGFNRQSAGEDIFFGEPGDTGTWRVRGSGTISLGVGSSGTTITATGNGGRVGINKTTLTGGTGDTTIDGIFQIASTDNATSILITASGTAYAGLKFKNGATNVGGGADWWDITVRPSYASGVASGPDQQMIRFDTPYAGQVAVVINEGSNDVDFRVESDTNTHALFVEASNSRVGVNTSNLYQSFTVDGAIEAGTDTSVGGGVSLYMKYGGASSDYIAVLGAKNSSGGPALNYGGYWNNSSQFISTYDNFTGSRSSLYLNGSDVVFEAASSDSGATTGTAVPNMTQYLTVGRNGFVFNEAGVDVDFRVESDTNTHALFVDAGNSRVGIGESNPARTLDVNGIVRVGYALNQSNPVQNTWYDIISAMDANTSYKVSLQAIKASAEEFAMYETLYVIGGLVSSTRTSYYAVGAGAGLEYRIVNNFPSANQMQVRVTTTSVTALRASIIQMP